MQSLLVRSERVVLPDGIRPASIFVRDGRIVAIGDYTQRVAGVAEIDAGERVVAPGLVDTHVHINDPGRAEWEGFEHATRSAAAGGVTTLVDMPLNSVPATTTVDAFEIKQRAATGRCQVDVAFWGGVVPGNVASLEPLARAGVLGFKAFLSPSGVEEFEHVSERDLLAAAPVLAALGLPLLVHAELPALLREIAPAADPRSYATWLESRPPECEHAAIELLLRISRRSGARVHIVHLASADALPLLRAARAEGVPVTVETCPHYLTFAAEDIAAGATAFKCAPPIRSRDHRERLWQALEEGAIDLVATDHSPAPPSLKRIEEGDFIRAWGGIASLQVGLAVMWAGASARGIPMGRVFDWLSASPARFAGLAGRKGSIVPGADADLIVWDADAESDVDPAALHHRHPITPYAGARVCGRVEKTILRGEIAFDQGDFPTRPAGRIIARHVV